MERPQSRLPPWVLAVEQLRGTAANQVAGAQLALVTGGPSIVPVSGLILANW